MKEKLVLYYSINNAIACRKFTSSLKMAAFMESVAERIEKEETFGLKKGYALFITPTNDDIVLLRTRDSTTYKTKLEWMSLGFARRLYRIDEDYFAKIQKSHNKLNKAIETLWA